MTCDDDQAPTPAIPRRGTKAEDMRQRRLAEALRENLKRRKAQARGRINQDCVPAADQD